jgi:hypothetical protein
MKCQHQLNHSRIWKQGKRKRRKRKRKEKERKKKEKKERTPLVLIHFRSIHFATVFKSVVICYVISKSLASNRRLQFKCNAYRWCSKNESCSPLLQQVQERRQRLQFQYWRLWR